MNNMEKIEALRKIVAEKQHADIDGMTMDLFTASAILKVFDALGPANQKKYASVPLPVMVDMAWKLLNK